MAYTTGTASSIDDFLTQFVTFAVANAGFTNEGTVTSSAGTGSRTIHRISKGGVHWFFLKSPDNKLFAGRMGYSALPNGGNPDTPGSAYQSTYTYFSTWNFTPPYVGHYFFTDGTCVHAAVEIASGIFNHWSVGIVSKYGTWTGGEYISGGYYYHVSNSDYTDFNSPYACRPFNDVQQNNIGVYCYARCTNTGTDSTDFKALNGVYNNTSGMFVGIAGGQDGVASFYNQVIRDAPNAFTNRTPIFPGVFRRYDYENNSGLASLAGKIPYVGFLKMTPDMNAKDIINTDWQVFPITMRTGGNTLSPSGASLSYEYALAYRRV